MMKRNKTIGLLLGGMLALAGCTPEEHQSQFSFNATMEQLQNADNSKVQLVNEEWTYWEFYDSINLVSNASTRDGSGNCQLFTGWLVNGGGGDYSDYDGVFISTLTESSAGASNWFVGIHPANYEKHQITYDGSGNHGFAAKVYLEPIQHYRHDSSYARQVLPMIATYDGPKWGDGEGETSTPYRLDFHTLAGLVRLQIVNGTVETKNISKIELTSIDFDSAPDDDGSTKRPLCGLFAVNNLYNFDAHLNKSTFVAPGGGDDGYTLTLSMSDNAATGSLEFRPNDLKSFYVVLPAFHGIDVSTYYRLTMTVYTDDHKKFSKNFTVRTRRNGITYMRAINITEFVNDDSGDNGSGAPVLVGNGTSTRPFKIYTFADLKYVRDQFHNPDASGNVYINGQLVTGGTYFRVMRSDIILRDATWTGGIENFRGHFTYYSNAPNVTHGIINRSVQPLFQSITADGYVNDLAVISDSLINITPASVTNPDYSPLCYTNYGHITDCRVISPTNLSSDNRKFIGKGTTHSCYAGICVENKSSGVVTNCICYVVRTLEGSSDFAGICKDNSGIINACATTSPLSVSGALWAGGICLHNNSQISNCYCDFHYTSGTTDWGGIVYDNTETGSSIVSNCYFSPNGIIRGTGTIGGIVCQNGGTIEYCRAEQGSLRGSTVGGIAATVSAGELRNCYVNDSNMVIYMNNAQPADHYAGGLVGYLDGGEINNCFALMNRVDIAAADATGKIGTVVGYINNGTVRNCYGLSVTAAAPTFYGGKANTGVILKNCFLVSSSGATQSGVGRIYGEHDHANSEEGEVNDLSELCTKLNLREELGTANYSAWQRETLHPDYHDIHAPYLVNPNTSKKRR